MTRRNRSGSAGSGDLFARAAESAIAEGAPLAARMRPRTLDEYVGQDAIVGRGRLLRRAIEADRLGSLIFYGPPGTGKTTLAQVIAGTTEAEFTALNAVLSGVKDIREAVARARSVRGEQGRRTILFIDEVHRFNKAQQDALLPWVENGTVILIGATTENPYFEVNAALVSRSRIFRLEPLTEDDLRAVADAALNDRDRGYGDFDVTIDADALDHLVDVANGDARALLNALELAVETTPPGSGGDVRVTLSVAEESIQQRAVFYDREGDAHFDAISAFIKACRGSDADAALYWLARMIHAGEDPRYLFRRLIILAGEDVGLADPDCIVRVEACAKAFDRIGLPEGRYPLAQATLLVATAPKSNSTMGFFEALATVKRERTEDVPDHLKDGTRDKEGFGHGEGYLYPHAYRDHWVAQQYLPAGLQGQVYYQPSDQGWEAGIRETVVRRREAQLAALELESSEPRGLTTGPEGAEIDRWTRRAMAGAGAEMGAIRDAVIDAADLQRHHVVCEARARTGLLTWEALRRCPEGSAWAWVTDPPPAGPRFADALREQVAALDALVRPVVFVGGVERAGPALEIGAPDVHFDRVIGHDVFGGRIDGVEAWASAVRDRLTAHGRIVVAEVVPREAQRLSTLVPTGDLDADLVAAWHAADDAIYRADDDRAGWTPDDLGAAFVAAGFTIDVRTLRTERTLQVSDALLTRWWDGAADRPGYAARLADHMSDDDVRRVRRWFGANVARRDVRWTTTRALVTARGGQP